MYLKSFASALLVTTSLSINITCASSIPEEPASSAPVKSQRSKAEQDIMTALEQDRETQAVNLLAIHNKQLKRATILNLFQTAVAKNQNNFSLACFNLSAKLRPKKREIQALLSNHQIKEGLKDHLYRFVTRMERYKDTRADAKQGIKSFPVFKAWHKAHKLDFWSDMLAKFQGDLKDVEAMFNSWDATELAHISSALDRSGALSVCHTMNELKHLLKLVKELPEDRLQPALAWLESSMIPYKCVDGDELYFLLGYIKCYKADRWDVLLPWFKHPQAWHSAVDYMELNDYLRVLRDAPLATLKTAISKLLDGSDLEEISCPDIQTLLRGPGTDLKIEHLGAIHLQAKLTKSHDPNLFSAPISMDALYRMIQGQQIYHTLKDAPKGLAIMNPDLFENVVNKIYADCMISETREFCSCIHFRPKVPNGTVLVHVHGGPAVEMTKDTLHAEIAYYLSHGYTVLCPNYYGTWKGQYADKSNEELGLPDAAVKDIIDSIKYARGLDGTKRVILRGGSYGSTVNSHTARYLKEAHQTEMIDGIHLMGGEKYPSPEDIPDNVPIFIAHGCKDEITNPINAIRFTLQLLYKGHRNVHGFFTRTGDHHMVQPLTFQKESSDGASETRRYLDESVRFVNDIHTSGSHQAPDIESQIQSLEALLKEVEPSEGHQLTIQDTIHKRSELLRIISQLEMPVSLSIQHSPAVTVKYSGPTMAHMRFVLGKDYRAEILHCLREFFGKHFQPVKWPEKYKKVEGLGPKMAGDETFLNQVTSMIASEEAYLANHPDSFVMYHATMDQGLRLYAFMNAWVALLQGQSVEELKTMRLYKQQLMSLENIDTFLEEMKQKWMNSSDKKDILLNYVKGFAERAIAAVPYLTAGRLNTACCSMVYFYDPSLLTTHDTTPVKTLIGSFLKVLGIYSESRVERYFEIFQLDSVIFPDKLRTQSLMQQVFVPYKDIDRMGYMCQMWGLEYGQTDAKVKSRVSFDLSIVKPSNFRQFAADPAAYEEVLQQNKQAFTNPEKLDGFVLASHKKSDLLQLRAILYPDVEKEIRTYFRLPERINEFMDQLMPQIFWDFSEFVLHGSAVPRVLIESGDAYPQELRSRLELPVQRDYSVYAVGEYEASKNYPGMQDGIFAGVHYKPAQEIENVLEQRTQEQRVKQRAQNMFKELGSKKELFDEERFCQGWKDSNDVLVKAYTGKSKKYPDYIIPENFGSEETAYFTGTSYLELIAEAATARLTDPKEYTWFMYLTMTFAKYGSGMKLKVPSYLYREYQGVSKALYGYEFTQELKMNDRAQKDFRKNKKTALSFVLDAGLNFILREIGYAKDNS